MHLYMLPLGDKHDHTHGKIDPINQHSFSILVFMENHRTGFLTCLSVKKDAVLLASRMYDADAIIGH